MLQNLESWRIAAIWVLIIVLCFLLLSLRNSFQYRWWSHVQDKKRANRVLNRWREIRAGRSAATTQLEKSITIMSEYQYMKEVRQMLWDHGLYEIGRSMWGAYTAENPFATINVEWDDQSNTTTDDVVYKGDERNGAYAQKRKKYKPKASNPLSNLGVSSSPLSGLNIKLTSEN